MVALFSIQRVPVRGVENGAREIKLLTGEGKLDILFIAVAKRRRLGVFIWSLTKSCKN